MNRLLAFLVCSACVASASATSMIPLSLEMLEAAASNIVVATTVSHEVKWVGKTIVTVYTLEVSDSVKGSATESLQLTLPGGSVKSPHPVTMRVPGVPRLKSKQRALLFLESREKGTHTLVGWEQGHFPIARDPQGREWVRAPMTDPPRAKAGVDAAGRMPLESLLGEIIEAGRRREADSD